jgi:hypothetical protein
MSLRASFIPVLVLLACMLLVIILITEQKAGCGQGEGCGAGLRPETNPPPNANKTHILREGNFTNQCGQVVEYVEWYETEDVFPWNRTGE